MTPHISSAEEHRELPSFEEIVARYKKTIFEISFRFLLNKEDAEDLTQEVFIEIYRNLKDFRGASGINTWITRIAINKALSEIRKRKRRNLIASIFSFAEMDGEIPSEEQPEQELIFRQQLAQLNKVLNALPENQRIAFTLSRVEGYGLKETANIMGITEDAVTSLITRAKLKLKKFRWNDGNPNS